MPPPDPVEGIRFVASPNCDLRPDGAVPTLVVIHAISLPPGEFGGEWIEHLFRNRIDPQAHPYFAGLAGLRVSSHFLVRRTGEVVQFVPVALRAWHAGVSSWRGRSRCNDFSIGIEVEGTEESAFDAPQYPSLAELIARLRTDLPLRDWAAHSDIAPARKADPGPHFDWRHLFSALAARG